MTTSQTIVIEDNGDIYRTTTTREKITILDSVLNGLNDDKITKVKRVLDLPDCRQVDLAVKNTTESWFLHLNRIVIRCNWFTTADHVLVPNFGRPADPMMEITWSVPSDMHLILSIDVEKYEERRKCLSEAFFIVFEPPRTLLRLPLPNVHNTGSVCVGAGNGNIVDDSSQAVIMRELEQFQHSNWNADLWDTVENTQKLFRFKPTNDGFEQLEPLATWKSLCLPVHGEELLEWL